jgi:hypothetical protein
MKALVFDDLGQMWTNASQAFEESFSIPQTQDNLTKYAVKPLGFVVLNMFGPSVQIRCALSVVAEPALDAAYTWLKGRKFERIAIDYYDDCWKMAVARSADDAIELLQGLLRVSRRSPFPSLMVKPRSLETLASVPAFAKLHAEWRAGIAGQVPFTAANLARRHLGGRYVVYDRGEDGGIYFSEVGAGFNHFGNAWAKSRGRLPITAQPDATYAAWIAGHYQEVLRTNVPRFDDIDVFARNDSGRRVRFRLKRVILPVLIDGHPPQLIGGSIVDERIDLRQDALDAFVAKPVVDVAAGYQPTQSQQGVESAPPVARTG